MASKIWSKSEESFLKKNYQGLSNSGLAEKLKVSPKAIESKLRRMGLKRPRGKRNKQQVMTKPTARDTLHVNIRCRHCLIVDGYSQDEETCRYCGSKLFKGDVF